MKYHVKKAISLTIATSVTLCNTANSLEMVNANIVNEVDNDNTSEEEVIEVSEEIENSTVTEIPNEILDYSEIIEIELPSEFENSNEQLTEVVPTKPLTQSITITSAPVPLDEKFFQFTGWASDELELRYMNGALSTEFEAAIAANDGVLVIPNEVGGKPVTKIGNFSPLSGKNNCYTEVVFPETVTYISFGAFSECSLIQKVTFSNALVEIGQEAFYGCNISELNFPANLKIIGQGAFSGNKNLQSITFNEGLEEIGHFAFLYDNQYFYNVDSDAELVDSSVKSDSKLTTVTLPSSIKTIGRGAFQNHMISTLNIPIDAELTTIKREAFRNNMLSTVTIPNKVTLIDKGAFTQNAIEELTLGDSVVQILRHAFSANLIETVSIPSSVKIIGDHAFAANKIKELTVPGNVSIIEAAAFALNDIETLVLEEGIQLIQGMAFYNNKINSVTIPSTANLTYAKLAFAQNKLEFIEVKDGVVNLPFNLFVQGVSETFIQKDTLITPEDLPYIVDNEQERIPDVMVKEIILPATVGTGIGTIELDPIPVPKYSVISKSTSSYTMFSQLTTDGVNFLPDSIIDKSEWSADRKHTTPAEFKPGTHGVAYFDLAGYPIKHETYASDYSVVGDIYRKFDVHLVTLPDDVKFKDNTTTLSGLSFMTYDELVDFLNLDENIPVKDGDKFVRWNIDKTAFDTATELLKFDQASFSPYLVKDIAKGAITPIFENDTQDLSGLITLKVNEVANQFTPLLTETNADLTISGSEFGIIKPNQEFTLSLTDGYNFIINNNLVIDFINSTDESEQVNEFKPNNDLWQYMLSADSTKIYIKAPKVINRTEPTAKISVNVKNLGVKDSDNFFGNRTDKVVNVYLNFNNKVVAHDVIAKLVFEPKFDVLVKQATAINELKTKNDGSISLASKIRYSFENSKTYVIKLDDEFRFTHDYGDVSKHVDDFVFSNTDIDRVLYVPTINDLTGDSEAWRFTVSSDFTSIYVKTPYDLFPNEDIDGTGTVRTPINTKKLKDSSASYNDGVAFEIDKIGITDITGVADNYINGTLRPVGFKVTTEDGKQLGSSIIAQLSNNPNSGGNGGGGGNSGGGNGGGNNKPKDPDPIVAPVELYIPPYLHGYPDNTVRPKGSITRAEVAQIIYNLYGANTLPDTSILNNYSDVSENVWYSDAISYVLKNNVFVGYPDNNFKPNEPITREEISAVLARLLSELNVSTNIEEHERVIFSDIDNSWAKKDIEYLISKGILVGYPDGEFKLKNSTMRSEFAALMNKLTERPYEYKQDNTYTDLHSNAWYYDDIMNASNFVITNVNK